MAGSAVYGGYDLDPDNLEGTFTHRIWVRRVRDDSVNQNAVLNIAGRSGVREEVVSAGQHVFLAEEVGFTLENVSTYVIKAKPFCDVCKRGGEGRVYIPQANFAFNAPREYEITRSDARRRR
tara:strand:- start:281 stop:646 length:366 start_codon:yes stop_codon:yes gene_type:complete